MNIIKTGSLWCSKTISNIFLIRRYGHTLTRVHSIKELLGGGAAQIGEKVVIKVLKDGV